MHKLMFAAAAVVFAFAAPSAAFAGGTCDVYHSAIMSCAKNGCNTSLDDFAQCLVEEQGITDKADDGTNEIKELVKCFKSEYTCR